MLVHRMLQVLLSFLLQFKAMRYIQIGAHMAADFLHGRARITSLWDTCARMRQACASPVGTRLSSACHRGVSMWI